MKMRVLSGRETQLCWVQLEKQLPNVVGKNVDIKESVLSGRETQQSWVVGKVTEYDKETGLATTLWKRDPTELGIEIDDDSCSKIGWNPIAGNTIGISSRVK